MALSSLITIIIAGFVYWYSSKKFNIKVMNFDKYLAILIIPLLLIILFMQSFKHSSNINIDTSLGTVKLLLNTSITEEIQAFLFL